MEWKKVKDIPEWITNANRRSPNRVYFKGNTFLYKVVDEPGKIQGDHIVTVYRKLRKEANR